MHTIVEFLINLFGNISTLQPLYYYFIVGTIVLLIFIDGVLTFLIGALQGLFYKNRF